MQNNSLPKLGRPFSGGSARTKYLKFYLTPNELNEFELLEKELSKIYESRGYYYSRPDHFRLFLKNLTNPYILNFLFENISLDTEKIKKD